MNDRQYNCSTGKRIVRGTPIKSEEAILDWALCWFQHFVFTIHFAS